MLWRALNHIKSGFYIDIGAQDPVNDSVSLAFHNNGWKGIHVEPVATYAQKLVTARPGDAVVQAIIGTSLQKVEFFEIEGTGLSSVHPEIATSRAAEGFVVKKIEVNCLPLSEILDMYPTGDVHWLKIDVEGQEADVLQSWGLSKVRPWIVVIERVFPGTKIIPEDNIEKLITDIGYHYAYSDGINHFFVSNNHPELDEYFSHGPNVFDNFILGSSSPYSNKGENNIAISDEKLSISNSVILKQDKKIEKLKSALASEKTEKRQLELVHKNDQVLAKKNILQLRLQIKDLADQIRSVQEIAIGTKSLIKHSQELEDLLLKNNAREQQLIEKKIQIEEENLDLIHIIARTKSIQEHNEIVTNKFKSDNLAILEHISQQKNQLEEENLDLLNLVTKGNAIQTHNEIVANQLKIENFSTLQRISQLELMYNQKVAQVSFLKSTASWKITAPLRALRKVFRRPGNPASQKNFQNAKLANSTPYVKVESIYPHESVTKLQTKETLVSETIYPTANNIQELVCLCDEVFVICAYQTLLNRMPEPEGLSIYLRRVRAGDSKIKILWDINRSVEGQLKNFTLPGLSLKIVKQQGDVSYIKRKWNALTGLSTTLRSLRIMENQIGMRFSTLDKRLSNIRSLDVSSNLAYTNPASQSDPEAELENSNSGVVGQVTDVGSLVYSSQEKGITGNNFAVQENNQPFVFPLPTGLRKLYVFVDHTIGCSTNTGVQRVVRGVASGLLDSSEQVHFVKWDDIVKKCVLINSEERKYLAKWNGPSVRTHEQDLYGPPTGPLIEVPLHNLAENNWLIVPEVTTLTQHQLPVTLDLIGWANRSGLKTGFIFYDAIPLRRKELSDSVPHHRLYMQHLRLANVVWSISDWSKDDLLAYWSESELATGKTIPEILTIALPGQSTRAARVIKPYEAKSIILSVGSIEPRKNQLMLIRAFQTYRKKNKSSLWQLILVGNLHPDVAHEVNKAIHKDSAIKYLGHVSDDALDGFYRDCAFTVFPSVEEGFGLPILESLWYAKPCLCANFGAMAEVAKDGGCLTVDVRDQKAFDKGLRQLIEDEKLRKNLSERAATRHFVTWPDYVGSIVQRIDDEASANNKIGVIYYWVNSTLSFPKNTGIQRVNRQLARSLLEQGFELIPVKWDKKNSVFKSLADIELEHLAKWNGPQPASWKTLPTSSPHSNCWFLMTELPLDLSTSEQEELLAYTRSIGLRNAAVFYDAIPWKMKNTYPKHYSQVHREYMVVIGSYDLALPISNISRDDLISVLSREQTRPLGLRNGIKTAMLPGEFSEIERVLVPKIKNPMDKTIRILSVGTVEPRKNHLAMIEAFIFAQTQTKQSLELVLVGRDDNAELTKSIGSIAKSHPSVRWEMNADDTVLRELYEQCDFTIYPSLEEGFGLPILESLWFAKPCICANFGAMVEVARDGGCLTVDVRNLQEFSAAILKMCNDHVREQFIKEATSIKFKSWYDYAQEVSLRLAQATPRVKEAKLPITSSQIKVRSKSMAISKRPLLSVCISTYNRADWLERSLRNLMEQFPKPLVDVEFLVCDNTSTDHTSEVVEPYLKRKDFTYKRNPVNVGMLGNLRETAHYANGQYIWIVGDDDLIMPGAVGRILKAIRANPQAALVYLNYAYTRIEDARTVTDFEAFFRDAIPIVPPEPDIIGPIKKICARNENFFTAIYTLVLRRDHATNAYSQNTSGRPFSTMLTCIPTTHYVLNHMMEETGVWIGTPQLVVNLNVSWMKYAPLWILERIPELYDLAESQGAEIKEVDRWRNHTLIHGVEVFFREIFENDPLNNVEYFDPLRLVGRFKHLENFSKIEPGLKVIYQKAHTNGHPSAQLDPSLIFSSLS